jgi:hypothetical protein
MERAPTWTSSRRRPASLRRWMTRLHALQLHRDRPHIGNAPHCHAENVAVSLTVYSYTSPRSRLAMSPEKMSVPYATLTTRVLTSGACATGEAATGEPAPPHPDSADTPRSNRRGANRVMPPGARTLNVARLPNGLHLAGRRRRRLSETPSAREYPPHHGCGPPLTKLRYAGRPARVEYVLARAAGRGRPARRVTSHRQSFIDQYESIAGGG